MGSAGRTLAWDPATSPARAQAGWMRDRPGRTFVAVDDGGNVVGSASTYPNHSGPGAHVAYAGFVVHPERQAVPGAFRHPEHGYVGLHIMHRVL